MELEDYQKVRTQLNVGKQFSPFIEDESDEDFLGDFEDTESTPRPLNNYCKTINIYNF